MGDNGNQMKEMGIDDKEMVSTYHLCDYATNDLPKMKAHGTLFHGIVHCDKCEYSADDLTILKKHLMTHTGRFPYICANCGFEATKESILEFHKETKHRKNDDQPIAKCEDYGKSFPFTFLQEYHFCPPQYKFGCTKCTFIGISMD